MAHIKDIPVRVIHTACGSNASAEPNQVAVLAILNELEEKLMTFQAIGTESTIDLKCLARSSKDISLLRSVLGCGEVTAVVTASGSSEINETAISCLWWVTHHDVNNQLRGTFLEVTEIPTLLRADRFSVEQGLVQLRALSHELVTPLSPVSMP